MFPKKPRKLKTVYLDHAAATPVSKDVRIAMELFFSDDFANPSTLYAAGVNAKQAIEESRACIAKALFAQPDTIVFTSGGTESCNLALLGSMQHESVATTGHIITTKVEHKAVLGPMKKLEAQGFEVTYLDVDENGQIDIAAFKKALRPETVMVCVMYVNNELGTVYPVQEIGREILKWKKKHDTQYPLFHIDACQAPLYFDLSVERLHCDLMSINGSKIYGPKGVGALYVRRDTPIEPIMYGGGQENGLRSGTENVPGIVGFGAAVDEIRDTKDEVRIVRDYFWSEIQKNIPDVSLNGATLDVRSPNNLHVWFEGVEAETLALYLSEYGIMVGVGSACTTGRDEDSHVLTACGFDTKRIRESVRFTLGKDTKKKDIDYVMEYLPGIVKAIRTIA